MEYVCRGVQIPAELRADATTVTSDVGAVIPTTTLQEIIKKLSSYGEIYAKVRKLNIQGGVRVPILSLKPTANWIGEGKSSDDQKITADKYVSFDYHGLECKISQSLLASIVTYEMFQREFVPLTVEAIIAALEKAIFAGTGSGQPLGITKDERVPADNTITLSAKDFSSWSGWKKNVFGKMKKSYRDGIFVMAQGTFDGYIDGMVDDNKQPIARVNYGITEGEKYRFGGKAVETVENDVIAGYDDAAKGDVVAVFFKPSDYAINSNMVMTVVKWTDHDDNKVKNKAILICDGKLLDPNGVLIIKKGE
jgi:HK97 family phage major capsid protein